jgi:hypothetical protein
MRFGAMGTWQAGLLIAAAAALAWWLFRLKVRPPRRAVPSLLLWRHVVDRAAERTWWDRIRRAVSLQWHSRWRSRGPNHGWLPGRGDVC